MNSICEHHDKSLFFEHINNFEQDYSVISFLFLLKKIKVYYEQGYSVNSLINRFYEQEYSFP